ncbi:MAG TPA: trigger factor [Solirubrobacterales bacterium]|nr:trigger factor [Solirubrobacterales bacterium]
MKTAVTELGDSRVRVDVGIEPDTIEKRVERAARQLAGDMRVPGFRKGKVPADLVIQRVGREAVLEQALRDSLAEWYERALLETGITPIGDPQLNVESLPGAGEELAFSIEVAVRPPAKLGEYKGLEVGKVEPDIPDEAVQEELDRLREGFAALNPVERPAAPGDIVVIDYAGTVDGEPFEGSEATDLTVEVGSESLLPEFDEALAGTSAGDQVTVEIQFPDDHRPESLAGKQATFAVTVKEVREKELPELDDEFASEASEFDTLEELREEIRSRIAAAVERRADDDFRAAAVDAAAENARIDLPKELVHARAHDMWERLERSLSARGIDPQAYVQMQGKSREELVTDMEGEAERALKREATLAAVADAEGIEVTDEELLGALGPGEGDEAPEKLLGSLRETGRDALLRSEVRLRKAADLIADSAKPIPAEQAAARDKLWTPEKEQAESEAAETGLWTPGSD